jgi:hypothetical protein
MTREEFLLGEIDTYRKRIATYQAMVAEWEKELGHVSTPAPEKPATTQPNSDTKKPGAGNPLSLIHGMVFFGKSQPEAVKAFLQMVGYPLSTQVILEGIEKGGVKVGGKDPKQNLYTILERSGEFGRVGKGGIWGLTTWPGVSKKNSDEGTNGEKKAEESSE